MSMETQAEKIRAMAVVQGFELAELISDAGESAKSINRPGLTRLLALVDAGCVRIVVIAKLDRLTRSVKDLADLLERFQKHGVALVSVAESLDTGSAAGRLVLNIMTAVSQWEREAMGERTRDVLRHKKSNGLVYTRKTPYGYERVGERLLPVGSEQAVIRQVKQHRLDGWTLRQIAGHLNDGQIPSKQGGVWSAKTVKDIVSKPEVAA